MAGNVTGTLGAHLRGDKGSDPGAERHAGVPSGLRLSRGGDVLALRRTRFTVTVFAARPPIS